MMNRYNELLEAATTMRNMLALQCNCELNGTCVFCETADDFDEKFQEESLHVYFVHNGDAYAIASYKDVMYIPECSHLIGKAYGYFVDGRFVLNRATAETFNKKRLVQAYFSDNYDRDAYCKLFQICLNRIKENQNG